MRSSPSQRRVRATIAASLLGAGLTLASAPAGDPAALEALARHLETELRRLRRELARLG